MDAVPVSKKLLTFGSKQIFLPKFTVALVRTPHLSPYHARFLVPLDFSKFDLRDYLYHAYNIKCHNIRSYVKQQPVRDTREQPRHWFRPESKKFMTVEMEKPFVWPEEPEDWAPWGKEEKERSKRDMLSYSGGQDAQMKREAAEKLREHAKMLLQKVERKAEGTKEQVSTAEKKKREAGEQERQEQLKKMDRLQFWEEQRTEKTVQGDASPEYQIKV